VRLSSSPLSPQYELEQPAVAWPHPLAAWPSLSKTVVAVVAVTAVGAFSSNHWARPLSWSLHIARESKC